MDNKNDKAAFDKLKMALIEHVLILINTHWFCDLGFRLSNTKCMSIIDMWKKMYHPNIVQLREVFTTKAFGDNCKLS